MTENESRAVALAPSQTALSVFDTAEGFELAQRMAGALVASDLVPKEYQGKEKLGNALIALDMARRTGSNPVMVMQNLDIIHGRPSWRSQFIIAALNASGLFSPLRFVMDGEGDARTCYAWAKDLSDDEKLTGPVVSIEMAKAEGWFGKSGSKWKTMPELMLRYRAAAFFGRLYAPHILMGMQTADEVQDTPEMRDVSPGPLVEPRATGDDAPAAPIKNADQKSVKITDTPAAAGKGRPTKADTDAAEADGRKAKHAGAPRETAPAELKPSLLAAWQAGWDSEPVATAGDSAEPPFDMETGEVFENEAASPVKTETEADAAPAPALATPDDYGF